MSLVTVKSHPTSLSTLLTQGLLPLFKLFLKILDESNNNQLPSKTKKKSKTFIKVFKIQKGVLPLLSNLIKRISDKNH